MCEGITFRKHTMWADSVFDSRNGAGILEYKWSTRLFIEHLLDTQRCAHNRGTEPHPTWCLRLWGAGRRSGGDSVPPGAGAEE